MFNPFRKSPSVSSGVAYTMPIEMQMRDKTVSQMQYVTEHYVATQVGDRQLILFRADTGKSYVVRRGDERLEPIDLSRQIAQMRQLRAALGEVEVRRHEDEREINGFACRRRTIQVESPVMVISGDFWVARVPELAGTALPAQRVADAAAQPFSLELEPDEIVIRSDVKVLAQGAEQDQSSEVVSVTEGIDELDAFDAMLGWKVAG